MIIFRIVCIEALADQSHQKVSIHSFIVVKRHEVQVIEAEDCPDQKDDDRTDAPRLLRKVLYTGSSNLSLRAATLGTRPLTAT
jgi:hypothetical protein